MPQSSSLLPLLVLVVFVALVAFVGFIAWSVASDISDKTAQRMEKKNIKFSKEGMRVGVKEVSTEEIADSTQSTLVKVWNSASLPAYKSKWGWGQSSNGNDQPKAQKSSSSTGNRKTYSKP